MAALLLLLVGGWPTVYGQALLDDLHSCDLLRYDVRAEPGPRGVQVDCRLTLRAKRRGPVRLLISTGVDGLEVTRDGRPVRTRLGAGAFEAIVRAAAPAGAAIPGLVRLDPEPPLAAGETATFRFVYRWRPPRRTAWLRAGREGVQTHLSGAWLPSMGDELFDARLAIVTDGPAAAPGRERLVDGARVFETGEPVQVLPLVTGRFAVHAGDRNGRRLELWLPPGSGEAPGPLLDDLGAVLELLESWFGALAPGAVRLIVDDRIGRAPSYCGGHFVVVTPSVLPGRAGRAFWIEHLAHEVSHAWWGHRTAFSLVGRGGTWLREGLAQWSGTRVAGVLLGGDHAWQGFRRDFRRYAARLDLRRGRDGVLFANEPTLADATYLDPPRVAYLRGSLVVRMLESQLGTERFLERLRGFLTRRAGRFSTLDDFAAATDGKALVDFYAKTSRLPDLRFAWVRARPGELVAEVRCDDAGFPGGRVRVVVTTDRGSKPFAVVMQGGWGELRWKGEGTPRSAELDPERITLDPVGSNNRWGGR